MEKLNFITNNVNGLSTSRIKRLKVFLHLQSKIKKNGFIFLQETHSKPESTREFREDFGKNNDLFFSHGASNSCGVAIGICGNFDYNVKKEISDPNGRYLLMKITIGTSDFALINIYNENNEAAQVRLLQHVDTQLEQLGIDPETNIVLGGDLNFYFDKNLEAVGGNPQTKLQSLAAFLKLKEKYDLCDIWRIKHKKEKKYTFRQRHYSGYLQRRLDFIFISNQLQTMVNKSEILVAISTDHSPVLMNLTIENINFQKGAGYWKYNSSLNDDLIYTNQLIKLIDDFLQSCLITNKQAKWELLKYEIRKFTIQYTKKISKEKRKHKQGLEEKLEHLKNTNVNEENPQYKKLHEDREKIYDEIATGIKIRSKCNWYELGEKSNKYFLNLEKKNAKTSIISKLFIENAIIANQKDIMLNIENFYKNQFQNKNENTQSDCDFFLRDLDLPSLSEADKIFLDKDVTEEELFLSLSEMKNDKSPGNDGLTCEFYKHFWDKVKVPLFESICHAKINGELSTSQRQAIIRLIEKKIKIKHY